jgi:predicted dehydrogenase
MRDAAKASGRTAKVGHEFRHTPQRAYIKQLLAEGYIGKFQLCTIELFLDRYVTREPRPLTWAASKAECGGVLGALGSHYIDSLRHWFGEVTSVSLTSRRWPTCWTPRPIGSAGPADDTFLFAGVQNGGIGGSVCSRDAGARREIVIRATTARSSPTVEYPDENGVVVGAAVPAHPLQGADPSNTCRSDDPTIVAAFRLLVRDYSRYRESVAPRRCGLRCQEVLDAVRESSDGPR